MEIAMTTMMMMMTNFHQLQSYSTETGRASRDLPRTKPARGNPQQSRLRGRGTVLRSANVCNPSDRSLSILPAVPRIALFALMFLSRARNLPLVHLFSRIVVAYALIPGKFHVNLLTYLYRSSVGNVFSATY